MSDFRVAPKLSDIVPASQEERDACERHYSKFNLAASIRQMREEFASADEPPEIIVPAEERGDDAPPL